MITYNNACLHFGYISQRVQLLSTTSGGLGFNLNIFQATEQLVGED